MTIADKEFTGPWDIWPENATGQELGHAANLWDLFTREVTFGGASTTNVITVPDNVASAVEWVDAGGIEYMRIDTQNAQPVVVWNEGGADVDHQWGSVLNDPALFIEGSRGRIGFGGVTAPGGAIDGANSGASCTLQFTTYSATDGNESAINFRKSASSTFGTVAATADNEDLGILRFQGVNTTPAFINAAFIFVEQDGAAGAAFVPGRMQFYTSGNASGAALAMIIDSDRLIAIGGGVTTPLAQLHVDQGDASGARPVLYLDQADISEELIEFNSTIGVGNAIEAVGAKVLTVTHFLKVTLPGPLTRYIPCGTIA